MSTATKHVRQLTTSRLTIGLFTAACGDSSSGGVNDVSNTSVASVQPAAGSASQSATVGTAVATVPSVVVRDERGNPVAGATVRFTVTAGGGSVANPTTTTNAQGAASAGSWTLGASPGSNVLQATVNGVSPVV